MTKGIWSRLHARAILSVPLNRRYAIMWSSSKNAGRWKLLIQESHDDYANAVCSKK
jgi:hypothetical protein